MEIIIKGESKEIADLVLAVQSRQEDSLENYEALKERLSRDFSEEVAKTDHYPFSHLWYSDAVGERRRHADDLQRRQVNMRKRGTEHDEINGWRQI